MHRHLVHGLVQGVMRGRRLQKTDPLSADAEEQAIGIGVRRKLLDLHEFAADVKKIVDAQLVPRFDADIHLRRIVIAESYEGSGLAAHHGARHRLALFIKNLNYRIDRRAEPPAIEFDNKPFAFLSSKLPKLVLIRPRQKAVARAGNGNGFVLGVWK